MTQEWGEPAVQRSPAEIEAERRAVTERETTRRWRMQMIATGVGLVSLAAVLLGITGAIMQAHAADVERDKATAVACVAAGNAWVENSSGSHECRKA